MQFFKGIKTRRPVVWLAVLLPAGTVFIGWAIGLMVSGIHLQQEVSDNVGYLRLLETLDEKIGNGELADELLPEWQQLTQRVPDYPEIEPGIARINDWVFPTGQSTNEAVLLSPVQQKKTLTELAQVKDRFRGRNRVISEELRQLWAQVNVLSIAASLLMVLTGILFWVSHRKNKQLELLREVAEKSTQAKSEFLSNMSHELRTPLNAVIGLTELIIQEDRGKHESNLKAIRNSASTLLHLVNEILDLAKVESGKMVFEAVAFSPRELFRGLRKTFASRLLEKNMQLQAEWGPELPSAIVGDPLRLNQVLMNLVNNGLKFSKSGGVTISVKEQSRQGNTIILRFDVVDTGIGIPEEQLNAIFDNFHQVSADAGVQDGVGLGLAISKNLVAGMGGTLEVSSAVGEGSRFFFSLPFELVEDADLEFRKEREAAPPTNLQGVRVLVGEDHPMNQLVIKQLLNGWKAEFAIANNGREVLELLEKESFHLVLLDLQMPDMDGLEATRAIRQQEAEKGSNPLPIIAVSADAFEETRAKAMEAGVNGFVTKPFDHHFLLQNIAEHLKKSGA